MCDSCPSVDTIVLIAGLFRALVEREVEALRAGVPAVEVAPPLGRAALWRAARSGLEGELVDISGPSSQPAAEVVTDLVRSLRPQLEAAGDWPMIIELTRQVLIGGTSAARQRRALRRRGRLTDVVDQLLAETAGCWPDTAAPSRTFRRRLNSTSRWWTGRTTRLAPRDRNRDRGKDRGRDKDRDWGKKGHASGTETDEAMTVSEERLRVGTEKRERGRAWLRKYVVTENVTKTVPVSHEEIRVEREPITDANVGAAKSGPDISEEEHEVVLHEERPVVEKDVVPTERVRLNKETTTHENVSGEVRKKEVDTDVDCTGRKRRQGRAGVEGGDRTARHGERRDQGQGKPPVR